MLTRKIKFSHHVRKIITDVSKFKNTLTGFSTYFYLLDQESSRYSLTRVYNSVQEMVSLFTDSKRHWYDKRTIFKSLFYLSHIVLEAAFLFSYFKRSGESELTSKIKDSLGIDYTPGNTKFETSRFISHRLFAKHLRAVAQVTEVYKITPKDSLESSNYECFIEQGETSSFIIIGTFVGKIFLIKSGILDKEFYHQDHDNNLFDDFAIKLIQEILQDLKHGMIEVIAPKAQHWEESKGKFSIVELAAPEVYDEEIFDAVFPAIQKSLDSGIKTGILLYGNYGVSKTTTVNYIMTKLDILKARVANNSYGIAKQALESIPSKKIVLIDDADIISNTAKNEETAELLNFLDSNCYSIVIIIVNDVNKICPAVIRSGRCDIKKFCPNPPEANIIKILAHLYQLNPKIPYPEKEASECASILFEQQATHAVIRASFNNHLRYGIGLKDAILKTLDMEKINTIEEQSSPEE